MDAALKDLSEHLAEVLGNDAIEGVEVAFGELTVSTPPDMLPDVLKTLKADVRCLFDCFIDITAADYPERDKRFEVVYHLLSPRQNLRIRIKTAVGEDAAVPSVVNVFPAADWYEREVFDLYGVPFSNHPDLRRILTDYGFQGHPMRKDFPLTGFVEVRYDEDQKRVVYEPVKLNQEFRTFDAMSPWEGVEYVLPGDEKAGEADKEKA